MVAIVPMTMSDLVQENERLKKLCRWQYITLGFYGTPYNYDTKNIIYHPLTGEAASGIMHDGGRDAREAHEIAAQLGFTPGEILSWPGPGVVINHYTQKASTHKVSE